MSGRRVAVIGAGAAGLVTARELSRAGHEPVVFEQSLAVGGVWVYSPDTERDPLGQAGPRIHGSLYASLRTNLPRDLMAFGDYPFDARGGGRDEWPRFPGHGCVREYLENFARDFAIVPLIRFGTKVVAVAPAQDGMWWLESQTGDVRQRELFDAVAVCNGHYSEPRLPALPGAQSFPARQLHSHNYREPGPFTARRVALLGASASALDLSAEIAAVAATVLCCGEAFAALPQSARTQGNLQDGSIRLTDGATIEPVDALIYCTGYHYRYPFMSEDCVTVEDNWVQPLYRDLLHQDHETLAFIGIPFRVVPFPLFELQAQWFTRLLSGGFVLPDRAARLADTERRITVLRGAGTKQRHFHQRSLDCYDYLDTLAEDCGAAHVPQWRRDRTAALMAHVAANPGSYRDRPLLDPATVRAISRSR
jgi:hypothetical protein